MDRRAMAGGSLPQHYTNNSTFQNYNSQYRKLFQLQSESQGRRQSGSLLSTLEPNSLFNSYRHVQQYYLNRYNQATSLTAQLRSTTFWICVVVLALACSSIYFLHPTSQHNQSYPNITSLQHLREEMIAERHAEQVADWAKFKLRPNISLDADYEIIDETLIKHQEEYVIDDKEFEELQIKQGIATGSVVPKDLKDINQMATTLTRKSKNLWDDFLIALSFMVLGYFSYLVYISRFLNTIVSTLVGLIALPLGIKR